MPVILVRNVAPSSGLCNGTRLICKEFYPKLIKCKFATGERKGQFVLIPRMPLVPSQKKQTKFKRIQFPQKPAFAMSVNKSQGQTLGFVGLWLHQPVFSHGQLYVALSRVQSRQSIKIANDHPNNLTKNIVWHQIFKNT
jgi:hypothetical protein